MSTKLIFWKQGQSLPFLGKKIIEFESKIFPGPSNDRVKIFGFQIKPDKNGNYIEGNDEGLYSEDELDAIQTFGTAMYVIDMCEKMLEMPISWSWEKNNLKEPLTYFIRKNGINARYLKEEKCIELDYFGPYEHWTYYCRSNDIIAHETGHAILDGLKPLWENGNIETRGLTEAFCDLMAIFTITSQLDLCELAIKSINGNLRTKSILTQFGVGYGLDGSPTRPIRTALNNYKYQPDFQFPYQYAEVLVACLYDLLIKMTHSNSKNPVSANCLYETSRKWQKAILKTFNTCPTRNCSLSEFQEMLIMFLREEQDIIRELFKARKIPG
ncbi:MAG: hypothetical protein HC819_00065 [Cyclobacteriaceae bacterium]|nr:hypothetical protein [Cyclobacteriaceae bacterium]